MIHLNDRQHSMGYGDVAHDVFDEFAAMRRELERATDYHAVKSIANGLLTRLEAVAREHGCSSMTEVPGRNGDQETCDDCMQPVPCATMTVLSGGIP